MIDKARDNILWIMLDRIVQEVRCRIYYLVDLTIAAIAMKLTSSSFESILRFIVMISKYPESFIPPLYIANKVFKFQVKQETLTPNLPCCCLFAIWDEV